MNSVYLKDAIKSILYAVALILLSSTSVPAATPEHEPPGAGRISRERSGSFEHRLGQPDAMQHSCRDGKSCS